MSSLCSFQMCSGLRQNRLGEPDHGGADADFVCFAVSRECKLVVLQVSVQLRRARTASTPANCESWSNEAAQYKHR